MSEIIVSTRHGVGYIALWPPQQCACGRTVAFAVNRDGQTRCIECDARAAVPPTEEGEQ